MASTACSPGTWPPASLLVREAGGYATDVDGGHTMFETGSIVAGNQAVHKALLEVLAGAGREPAAAEGRTGG